MKKTRFLLSLFVLGFFVWSATGSEEDNNEVASSETSFNSSSSEESITSSSSETSKGEVNLRRASIIAHDFVEDKMGDCDFDDLDYRGGETSVPNRFKVLQKFTNKGEQYVYKIFIQYKGGEWEDRNNWSYGELTIENTKTGKQYRFNGTMKTEERSQASEGSKLTAAGIEFNIAEQTGKAIRIYNNKRLPLAKIKAVARELYTTYEIIQFAKYPKINRVEDYCAYQNNLILEYDIDKITSFNPSKD